MECQVVSGTSFSQNLKPASAAYSRTDSGQATRRARDLSSWSSRVGVRLLFTRSSRLLGTPKPGYFDRLGLYIGHAPALQALDVLAPAVFYPMHVSLAPGAGLEVDHLSAPFEHSCAPRATTLSISEWRPILDSEGLSVKFNMLKCIKRVISRIFV